MESTVVIKQERKDIQDTYECVLPADNDVNYTVPSCNERDALSTYVSTKTENSEEELSPIPPWLASETIEPAVTTEDGTQSTIPLHDRTLHSPAFVGSVHTEEHPATALRHFRIQEDDQEEGGGQEMGKCNDEDEKEKEKEHTCPQCPYTTDLQSNMSRHIKESHENRRYPCPQCDHVSKRAHHLKRHVLARHTEKEKRPKKDPSQPMPFNCDACDYGTEVRHRLVEHMRTHTGERPYKCPHCDATWPRKLALDHHLARAHTGERPFMCGECGYSTVHRGHLVQHMRTHTGQRPYKCSECDYTANRKHHIDIHMVKHTDSQPFTCELCEFKTNYQSSLRQHRRVHMNPKPPGRFRCELCDFSGDRIQFLQHHMKRKHGSVQGQETSV
ncbi:ZNF84 [Branchiostoma lanceolatum]|uniref:ZNF84 protein n=1 Tax=Branchiostoma lanceolatum TaxID=7740 RepID=A0A8K0EJ78_BRALA|nr:ZNF84 [Branchiostoma lanceolatum]